MVDSKMTKLIIVCLILIFFWAYHRVGEDKKDHLAETVIREVEIAIKELTPGSECIVVETGNTKEK